jgi:hypothetical protein
MQDKHDLYQARKKLGTELDDIPTMSAPSA